MNKGDIVGVSIVWHDDPEKLVWHEAIAIGYWYNFSDEQDEDIFFYVRDEAELEAMRDPENGNGWHIVGIDE